MNVLKKSLATTAAILIAMTVAPALASAAAKAKHIVIVHGAFADGSGWQKVTTILQKDGYAVTIVQPPLTSLEDDVTATQRILDRTTGPVVLVGHSYGGAVITEAGNDPKVTSLVYVAAFAPDEGEPIGALLQTKASASTGIAPDKNGYLFLDPAVFAADFAGDVPKSEAKFMSESQMPVNSKAFGTPISSPAWKTKPSYGIVATEDRMLNPDLERTMYKRANSHVTEIKSSHVVFLSHPDAVAKVIERAAQNSM